MDQLQHYSPLLGRILIALPFVDFAIYKFNNWAMMEEWMGFSGVPMPGVLLGVAVLIELAGGLGLAAGFKARWLAAILVLYLIPVHAVMHAFWSLEAGPERQAQVENFGKGMMIMGGLLFVFAYGPGPVSVDTRRPR